MGAFFCARNEQLKSFDVFGTKGGDPPPTPPLVDQTFQISTYKLGFREVALRHSRYTPKIPRFGSLKKIVELNYKLCYVMLYKPEFLYIREILCKENDNIFTYSKKISKKFF